MRSQWCDGATRSGKTPWLISQLTHWGNTMDDPQEQGLAFLVFAPNGDNRMRLADRIATDLQGRYPVLTTTPSGFIQSEIELFWPLLVQKLALNAQFPLLLRPENEQDLATRLWQDRLQTEEFLVQNWQEPQIVRRSLDFYQLAASAAMPAEDLPLRLPEGIPPGFAELTVWETLGRALVEWRDWCLARGLITYAIATELYWRHLLPHPDYQAKLTQRYCGVLADDVDEYPGVATVWFAQMMDLGLPAAFTWNEFGKVRLGVGADPDRLLGLRQRCEVTALPLPAADSLAYTWADQIVAWVQDPLALPEAIESLQTLQTTSRGEILRTTAEKVIEAIEAGTVQPSEVAIIAPGLDAIARYTLTEILTSRGIPVESLNDQRPLISSPLIRALLTLMALIYPGLGRLVDRDGVAEMLVVLSQRPLPEGIVAWYDTVQIDPVRAELIVDHCFAPDIENPELLPVDRFPRWDRLGHKATTAYEAILDWIAQQKAQRQQRLLVPGAVALLDRAIQQFFWGGSSLPYDQLAAIRELMETAQHYWEVEDRLTRLAHTQGSRTSARDAAVGQFIQLLRQGIVTANPFPVRPTDPDKQGVTIATVFQYRLQRLSHRWHCWLDAGSPRWLTGTDALFGYPIFLSSYAGCPWTMTDIEAQHQARLERILRDLLGRATERVFLCHSDLAVSGQEQTGPLLTLVNVAGATEDEPIPEIV